MNTDCIVFGLKEKKVDINSIPAAIHLWYLSPQKTLDRRQSTNIRSSTNATSSVID
jgi:hypothetical protein